MKLIWGVTVTGLSMLAWGGQTICALFPKLVLMAGVTLIMALFTIMDSP